MGKPVNRTLKYTFNKRNVENLTEASLNLNRNSRKHQTYIKLLILHVPVINFDRINFTLFCSENINLPSEKFWEMFVKLNGTTLYLFIIMIQLGLLHFLTDMTGVMRKGP